MFESLLSNPKRAILGDRLYVNGALITEELLEYFQSPLIIGYDECNDVPITETMCHYDIMPVTRDDSVYAFNRGNLTKLMRLFQDFEIEDRRVEAPMRHPLRIKFQQGFGWRDYQPDAIEALLAHDYGLLQAPPRSGKTLMMTAAMCMDRQKTIVLAHQTDLLEQLLDTFENFTNLSDLSTPSDPIVAIAEEWEDFDKLDVVLCTKQTFDHVQNRQHLAYIQRMFGAVYVDEAHFLAADVYSRTINRFWSKRRHGVTATPRRKDGREVVINGIVGPVVYKITPEQVRQVPVEVERINTGIQLTLKTFVKIMTKLAGHERRNELIVSHAVSDVAKGHSIIMVTDRKQHTYMIQKMLEGHGIRAEVFNGDLTTRKKRKETLDRARSGEAKVLIAMRNMTTGLDIPRADMFYNILPSSNAVAEGEHKGEGGYEQQCTRIRTEFPGKTIGRIKDFVDNFGVAYACWNERKKTYEKIGAKVLGLNEQQDKNRHQILNESMDNGDWG